MSKQKLPQISVRIDWITASWLPTKASGLTRCETAGDALQAAFEIARHIADNPTIKRLERPLAHYQWAFEVKQTGARIDVSDDPTKQGHRVTMSGEVMARSMPASNVLQGLMDLGARATRIDVAFDVMNSGVKPVHIAKEQGILSEDKPPRGKNLRNTPKGQQFEAGSRESQKFLRVYDKGREQKIEADWLRLELEMKGAFCLANMELAAYHPHQFAHVIWRMLEQPSGAFWDALLLMGEYGELIASPPPRVRKPRAVWFETQVLQALLKWSGEDYQAVLDWFTFAHGAVEAAEELRAASSGDTMSQSIE